MSYNSGKVLASISIDNASKRTATIIGGSAGVASTTIGTVGAGKVWRVLSVHASIAGVGAFTIVQHIDLNDVSALGVTIGPTATIGMFVSDTITWNYSDAPVLAAGQTIKSVVTGAGTGFYNVSYVEEDA
jgi:hypothetical protein